MILSEGETFSVEETWLKRKPRVGGIGTLNHVLGGQEKEMIETALREAEGVVGGPTGAAARLGIPRETLNSKIRKLGIKRHAFRSS